MTLMLHLPLELEQRLTQEARRQGLPIDAYTLHMAEELLILVDGSSYLYRAFHALPALSSSKGEPTGAIHGMIAMLRRLIKDHQPTYFAVVLDAKGETFRDALYPQYKANQSPI
jgi:DNA polymerase-1